MEPIKIGDRVKVVNQRKTHEKYSQKFEELNFKNKIQNFSFKNKTEAVVFGITTHEFFHKLKIYALRDDDGNECLISQKGIKKIKNVNMNIRNIKLDIATAERWLQGENQELRDLALQTFPELGKKKLPKAWEEIGKFNGYYVNNDSCIFNENIASSIGINRNIFATKEQAEASIALAQLSQLREVYRDGWKPDWSDEETKYCVIFNKNTIKSANFNSYSEFLSFQSAEVRDEFLENFRELIEQAKPLLS